MSRTVAPDTLRQAAEAFDLDPEALGFVRDVANVVHVHGSEPDTRFLRLTHREDRSPDDVRAEVSWIRFLVAEGLPVCRPLPGRDGRHTARVGDFTAVSFARVRGRPCELADFEAPVFTSMGSFLGRLHRASTSYEAPAGEAQRLHWHALDSPERVLASWTADEVQLKQRFEAIYERLLSRRVPASRYGLVHGDVHRGNILLHQDGIDVYDFDDCCRAFLAMDVANALYYSLWDRRYLPELERSALAHDFLGHLLGGYRREMPFDERDLALLPDLLEYRELAVDAFSYRRFEGREPDAETVKRWAHVRARTRQDAPYVDLDLAAI